jgi:hypothetical protein
MSRRADQLLSRISVVLLAVALLLWLIIGLGSWLRR